MRALSRLVHWILFALLLLVPLTAITGSWLEGRALTLYAVGDINAPFATSAAAGRSLLRLHPWLGDAILWIAGLQAAAALFHTFVLRDGVLKTMLP